MSSSETEVAIMAAIGELADAYSNGDYRRVTSMYVPDPGVVAFGPSVGEKWIGPEAIAWAYARDFRNFPDSELEFNWASIAGRDGVAWVAADCKAHVKIDGRVLRVDGRFTAVFERRGDRWLIAQSHFSFPAAL
ncbi:MAG: nuclear transport factor 2 family protein [Deltaproteobacteria bacterium]|nr:nuclear transport factor 2 family protein [Deltaproteobacteria bacterium]